jgi:hypothetical protein
MTLLDVTGHRFARPQHVPATDTRYTLRNGEGFYLHQSLVGAMLTQHRAYAWTGTREQMRNALDTLPEGVRKSLRAVRIEAPRPAGRAR